MRYALCEKKGRNTERELLLKIMRANGFAIFFSPALGFAVLS
jgi:hypothetical protein